MSGATHVARVTASPCAARATRSRAPSLHDASCSCPQTTHALHMGSWGARFPKLLSPFIGNRCSRSRFISVFIEALHSAGTAESNQGIFLSLLASDHPSTNQQGSRQGIRIRTLIVQNRTERPSRAPETHNVTYNPRHKKNHTARPRLGTGTSMCARACAWSYNCRC